MRFITPLCSGRSSQDRSLLQNCLFPFTSARKADERLQVGVGQLSSFGRRRTRQRLKQKKITILILRMPARRQVRVQVNILLKVCVFTHSGIHVHIVSYYSITDRKSTGDKGCKETANGPSRLTHRRNSTSIPFISKRLYFYAVHSCDD